MTLRTMFWRYHAAAEPVLSRWLFRLSRWGQLSLISSRDREFVDELPLEWTRILWQNRLWQTNHWYGVPILQWPTDLLLLQELVHRLRPKRIIETGTYRGGSAVFFASLFELFGIEGGRLISVDIELHSKVRRTLGEHPLGDRLDLVVGSSTAPEIVSEVTRLVGDEENVLVFLDSDHSYRHVLEELRAYSGFVPVGGYVCVSDTIMRDLHDLPLGKVSWREDNPHRALVDFLREDDRFEIDRDMNRLRVGFAPDGFLRRTR